MRCTTCRGAVHFRDGGWVHVTDTKCAAVVVEWPAEPASEDHEAA